MAAQDGEALGRSRGGLSTKSTSPSTAGAGPWSAGGRPPDFDPHVYRQRNVVERCFNRRKQWRDLATRYAKRAAIYRSSLQLIAAIIWLR